MQQTLRLVVSNPQTTPFDTVEKKFPPLGRALAPLTEGDLRLALVKLHQLNRVMPHEAAVVAIVVDGLLRDYYDAAHVRLKGQD